MALYTVLVHDEKVIEYEVEAKSQDDAKYKVESSDDPNGEFVYTNVKANWWIHSVHIGIGKKDDKSL